MPHVSELVVGWDAHLGHPGFAIAVYRIDGVPLQEHVARAGSGVSARPGLGGSVSPLGWATPEYQRLYVDRLLLRAAPALPSGRREILVCSECADLGCGCISAEVRLEEGFYVWSRLGTENNSEPDSLRVFRMGDLRFRADDLHRALSVAAPAPTKRGARKAK